MDRDILEKGVVSEKRKGLLYYIIYIEEFPFHLRLPGIGKKILNDVLAPIRVIYDIQHILSYRALLVELFQNQTGIYEYATQRVIYFMGHTSSQLTE